MPAPPPAVVVPPAPMTIEPLVIAAPEAAGASSPLTGADPVRSPSTASPPSCIGPTTHAWWRSSRDAGGCATRPTPRPPGRRSRTGSSGRCSRCCPPAAASRQRRSSTASRPCSGVTTRPDEELIRACVDSYRWVAPDSDGLLQASGTLQDRYREHGDLVSIIGELGHRLGLRIWIAPREQRRIVDGRPVGAMLTEIEQRVYLPLVTPGPTEALEQVDCIWYLRGKATFMFEVEWTAMLGEPVLRRGAAIPSGDTVVRFLVIPAARTDLVRLKLARSPLLRERLDQDNWHIIKAEHLRRFVAREDPDLGDLAPLLGLDPPIERQGEQLPLFG